VYLLVLLFEHFEFLLLMLVCSAVDVYFVEVGLLKK
jgi:hypothetical protein